MAVISLSSAQLAFGHFALLDHAEFSLETGERVGLIGRNGTGKSSLLKIISGRFKLDDGLLVMQQGLKIAYVEQEPVFEPEMSVYQAVASGMGDLQDLLQEYDALTGQFGQGDDDALMERMHDIQVKLDAADAWNLKNKVEATLDRLNLDYKGSVLFITHDRSFLDNVATRIIELDRGRLLSSMASSMLMSMTWAPFSTCWRAT
eukprot:gene30305-37498_t